MAPPLLRNWLIGRRDNHLECANPERRRIGLDVATDCHVSPAFSAKGVEA